MVRFISVKHCIWAFYECLEAKDYENASSYFESLLHHYKQRGKRIKDIKYRFEQWEDSRGAYIMSQEYRDELKEVLFKGKTKGISINTHKIGLK